MKKSGHSQDRQVAPVGLQSWLLEAGWQSAVESDPTWEAKRPTYFQLRKPGEEEYIMAEPLQSSWPPTAAYHKPSCLQEEEMLFNKMPEAEVLRNRRWKILLSGEALVNRETSDGETVHRATVLTRCL